MSDPLFGPEVRLMLADNDAAGLKSLCEDLHPATVAEALDDGEFTPEQVWSIISPANIRTQAAVFEYLPPARQVEMIEAARPQAGQLVGKMSHDDRADLLRRLPGKVRDTLLRLVDEADRKDIATLNEYGEGTVGARMTTDYAWLPPTMSAAEAIDQLRQQAPDRETIYYVYVLGDAPRRDGGVAPRKLLGVVSLRDLILAPRHAVIKDIMSDEVVALRHDDPAEAAAELLAKYDFIAVPVLDAGGGMLGIVTHDDALDVLREGATEDLQRQAGVGPIEGSYLDAGFRTVWVSRVKWLALLFLLQMVTVNVMAAYEHKIAVSAALVACLPLVLSVGGNAGSQAATLVVRALALAEVEPRQWVRVLGRELLMGLALAGTLGVLALGRTYLFTPGSLVAGEEVLVKLTYTLGLAVLLTCLWGTLLGAMLPLFFRRTGFDPALISSPAIATLSDVSGIVIYANVALVFFAR
jgi:magnesium transporter